MYIFSKTLSLVCFIYMYEYMLLLLLFSFLLSIIIFNPFKTLSQTSGWLLLPVITAIPLACLFKTGFHVSQCNPGS